jgi:putative membrane protein
MVKSLLVIFKGFFVGGTMMVPGVSGGSMAMILGIYNSLIESIANLRKEPIKNILFLMKFCIGAMFGIVLFSRFVIAPLLELFPLQVSYFFLGAVAGGVPMIYKTAGVKKFNLNAIIYPVIGIIFVLLIALIPEGIFTPSENFSFGNVVLQLVGGVLIAVGLILPGISVSQLLLMLGLYSSIISINGISDLLPLIPLGIGGLIGCLASAKIMDKAMKKNPEATYLIVFGFLLGSLYQLFPGLPTGLNIPICLVTFAAGFCFIYFLQKLEK